MTRSPGKRVYWLIGTLMLVAILAVWRFIDSGPSPPVSVQAGLAGMDTPELQPGPAEERRVEPELEGRIDDIVKEVSALDQYREMTRYPQGTRRLAMDSHDLLNPGARHERRSKLQTEDENPNPGWEVLFTADRYFVRAEEPVLVSLQVWNRDGAVLPENVSLRAEPFGEGGSNPPVKLSVQTDGQAKTAVFTPNLHWPDYVGQVRVTVEFSAGGLRARNGQLDFFFTGARRVPARFSGRIGERLEDGNLVFDVGLEVARAGTFRIDGILLDGAGQPFGWARFEGPLQQGMTTAALRFYGLLFHDARAEGHYVLSGLHGYRLRPGDVPHREDFPEYAGDYMTRRGYDLSEFRSDVNDSPRRQRMIEMYEEAERRGVRLTRPEYSGDG